MQELLSVNATDDDLTEDNNRVKYYFLQPVKGFSIHPTNGIVTVNKSELIRPLAKEVELAVVAEDSGKPSTSSVSSVIVRVNTMKSNLPGKEYELKVKENTRRGATLMRLSDVDSVDDNILDGDENGVFEVIRGKLILAKTLDRETKDR